MNGYDTPPAALVTALSQKCVMFHHGAVVSRAVGESEFFTTLRMLYFLTDVRLKKKSTRGHTLCMLCQMFCSFFSFLPARRASTSRAHATVIRERIFTDSQSFGSNHAGKSVPHQFV